MNDTLTEPSPTGTSLLGSRKETLIVDLDASLRDHGIARNAVRGLGRRLLPLAHMALDHQIVVALVQLVDVDAAELARVFQGCWTRYRAVTEAIARTATNLGSREVVVLAQHRITSIYHPYVDILLDGVKAGGLEFTLNVVYEITGLSVVVEAGRITSLEVGGCQADVALSWNELELQTWSLDLDLSRLLAVSVNASSDRNGGPIVPWQGSPRPS